MSNAIEYFKKVERKKATSIERMLRRLHREDTRHADGNLFERSFEDYLNEIEETPDMPMPFDK